MENRLMLTRQQLEETVRESRIVSASIQSGDCEGANRLCGSIIVAYASFFFLKRKRSACRKPTEFQKASAVLLPLSTSSAISSIFILLHSSTKRFARSLPTPFRRWLGLTKKSFTVITRPSSAEVV